MKPKKYKASRQNINMPKGAENKAILKANRYLIIQRLMAHKKIREIATEIGVGYDTLYTYLATGAILHDE